MQERRRSQNLYRGLSICLALFLVYLFTILPARAETYTYPEKFRTTSPKAAMGQNFSGKLYKQSTEEEPEAIKLPAGFVHEVIASGLTVPIDMAILPSGDILIVQKGLSEASSSPANLYLLREPNGAAVLEQLMAINVNAGGDSGIISVLLDPNFEQNRHFYLWHTTPGTSFEWLLDGTSKYQLTRYTLDTIAGEIDPASKLVIIGNITRSYYHGGGGIAFNNQGDLFIATGDASKKNWQSHVSQDLTGLLGKILRIRPTESGYEVPADNPFIDQTDALPEIYARGLRNPFRMIQRAADDTIFVGDVGADIWEELNIVRAGANYGWPIREGPCPRGQRQPCETLSGDDDSEYTEPEFFFPHPIDAICCNGGAIAGMAFYTGSSFPSAYHNRLFVADYNYQTIAAIIPDGWGYYDGPHFAENIGYLTDIEYFDERLYLLDIINGTVSRLSYYGDESPPTALLSTNATIGSAPLQIQLDGSQSTSVQELPLTYEWHLDGGSAITVTQTPTIEYTFEEDGAYEVKLVVIDSEMRRSPTTTLSVNVYSGVLPEINLMHSELISRTLFHGGDEFIFAPMQSADLADLDADQPFTWDLAFHHNQHIHPMLSNLNVMSETVRISGKNHGGIDIWYEIGLTMHTATGQAIRVSKELRPEYTQVSVTTVPPLTGTLTLDGQPFEFPEMLEMVINVAYTIEMPQIIENEGRVYQFDQWVDAVLQQNRLQRRAVQSSSRTIIPSSQPESLKASYIELEKKLYLPIMTQSE